MSTPKPSTVCVGRRYRANRLNGPYDAIVIGSGIGGLTTAACLSKLGKKVAVFEQHYTAGGFTHSYDRNGYEWDVGVHYIGDMGDQHIDLVAGPANFANALKAAFPGEGNAIDTYLGYLKAVSSAMPSVVIKKMLPERLAGPLGALVRRQAPAYLNKTTREVLESLTSNQTLIATLTGQWGDNGLPPACAWQTERMCKPLW